MEETKAYKEIYIVSADGEIKAFADMSIATSHIEALLDSYGKKAVTINRVTLIDD